MKVDLYHHRETLSLSIGYSFFKRHSAVWITVLFWEVQISW